MGPVVRQLWNARSRQLVSTASLPVALTLTGLLVGCKAEPAKPAQPAKPTAQEVKTWCVKSCDQDKECGIETGRSHEDCLAQCDAQEGIGSFDSRCGAVSFAKHSCLAELSCAELEAIGKAPLSDDSPCAKQETAVTACINGD